MNAKARHKPRFLRPFPLRNSYNFKTYFKGYFLKSNSLKVTRIKITYSQDKSV